MLRFMFNRYLTNYFDKEVSVTVTINDIKCVPVIFTKMHENLYIRAIQIYIIEMVITYILYL